jgi:hypothetical protein
MTVKTGFWMLPLLLCGSSLQLHAQNTVQVLWQNSPTSLLRDQAGKALSAGAPAAGDGSVIQFGYYSQATVNAPFEGTFIPLTGKGASNVAHVGSSIGDAGGGPDGRFSLSSVFELDSNTSGFNLPQAGTPLAVRFFNTKTVAGATHYNAVTGGANWRWASPANAPGEVLSLSMEDPGLVWKGGPDSALRTAVSCAVTFGAPLEDQSVSTGAPATFRVAATGLEPLFFQWRKGGVPIAGATGVSYTVAAAKVADAGVYDVLVSNPAGSFRSSAAALKVDNIRGGFLIDQPDNLKAVKSSKASQTILVQPDAPDVAATNYQLYALKGDLRTAVPGMSGVVPTSGILPLSVRAITTAGDYVLHFKRTYKDGTVEEIDSEFFHIDLKSWEDAAGSYEALLEDVNHLPSDNARYRGALSLTLTRTGAISGRLTYSEAAVLPGAESQDIRAYVPVTRNFTALLSPVDGADLQFVAVPVMGSGLLAHRQDLLLELDASTTPPSLKATVRDHASVGGGVDSDGIVSQSTGIARALAKLPTTATGLAGNYTLSSQDTAYLQMQVLPTGRVSWLSRADGYSGTGSAALLGTSETTFTAALTEATGINTSSLLNSRSLRGTLVLSRIATGTWKAAIGTDFGAGALESQSSYVTKVKGAFAYDAQKFAAQQNWSGVRSLNFPNTHTKLWTGASTSAAPDFLKNATVLLLKAHDPLASGTAVTHQWSLTVNSAGVVTSTPLKTDSVTAPALTLRLDKTRAGFTGQYQPAGDRVRRTLVGTALMPVSGSSLRAQGWSEAGALPALRTGAWTLEVQP